LSRRRSGVARGNFRATAFTSEIETPPVSWLGGILSGAAFPQRRRVFRRSVRRSGARPIFSALQSRSGGGFSPPSRARSFVVNWPAKTDKFAGIRPYLNKLDGFFAPGLRRNPLSSRANSPNNTQKAKNIGLSHRKIS
jgi:hypothetical protein